MNSHLIAQRASRVFSSPVLAALACSKLMSSSSVTFSSLATSIMACFVIFILSPPFALMLSTLYRGYSFMSIQKAKIIYHAMLDLHAVLNYSCAMDETFLAESITATKAQIRAYEGAILYLAANPTQSYRLDTGQSVQDVTRANLAALQVTLDTLYNRLCTFGARQNGAATIVQPCF